MSTIKVGDKFLLRNDPKVTATVLYILQDEFFLVLFSTSKTPQVRTKNQMETCWVPYKEPKKLYYIIYTLDGVPGERTMSCLDIFTHLVHLRLLKPPYITVIQEGSFELPDVP